MRVRLLFVAVMMLFFCVQTASAEEISTSIPYLNGYIQTTKLWWKHLMTRWCKVFLVMCRARRQVDSKVHSVWQKTLPIFLSLVSKPVQSVFSNRCLTDNLFFKESASLVFKHVQVVRMIDIKRNTLVYLTYSDRVIEGSWKVLLRLLRFVTRKFL